MKSTHYLDQIMRQKRLEIKQLIQIMETDPNHPLNVILDQNKTLKNRFSKALDRPNLTVIGELKRRSPSRGDIQKITDPVLLAMQYCQGGASAISVLTDSTHFGGSINDLQKVSHALAIKHPDIPTLRKDFIIHPLQLAEAVFAGASAVLLIACVLGKELKMLIKEAGRLGLETLTEIHDIADLELAIEAEAPVIGVNHRNLKTFEIDLNISEALRKHIPPHVIAVAESGIHTPEQAQRIHSLGYHAILVGEALIQSKNPSELIMRMKRGFHGS
jgi:indole-3-glycerol phosphate synthase